MDSEGIMAELFLNNLIWEVISMKRFKVFVVALITVALLASVSAKAAYYYFQFPALGDGEPTCWSEYSLSVYQGPRIIPSTNPHATYFYMTKASGSYTTYTQTYSLPANATGTRYLQWNTGYSPSGSYYLMGMPNINGGTWSDYLSSGDWYN